MRILIIAANGQLGVDATEYFKKKHEVIPFKDVELDITDKEKLFKTFADKKPDMVLNCAAITNVDGCETNQGLAFKVNGEGAGNVAEAAEAAGAALVHISTDYVFAGNGTKPYKETDPTAPNTAYGKSKLEGERLVQEKCKKHFIMRTAWLYGPNGNNFFKTMVRIGGEKGQVGVVTDQVGNPTTTFELIRIIDAVIKTEKYGIYHSTCEGICSWNEFAREIFRQTKMDVKVSNVTSEEFKRPAPRPAYSALSKEKLFANTGYRPTDWKTALSEYVSYINK